MNEFFVETSRKYEIVDITEEVGQLVKDVKDGMVLVYVPHATAGIIINESYDPSVCNDIINYLNKSIPEGVWEHDKVDDNGAAHIKASIIGPSEMVIAKDGKLVLGRWQMISLIDFDGPRKRKVLVKIV